MGHHQTEGPAKWSCYRLCVINGDPRRYVVGWMMAERESAELATKLIERNIVNHTAARGRNSLNSDVLCLEVVGKHRSR